MRLSRLYDGSCGRMIRASSILSMAESMLPIPAALRRKLTSNFTFWPRRLYPLRNLSSGGTTSSMDSAHCTSSFEIPVSCLMKSEMDRSGFTSFENSSTISPFSTLTAPISMISFRSGSRPVVSMSMEMNVSGESIYKFQVPGFKFQKT